MNNIYIQSLSSYPHVTQILTGFKMLAESDSVYTLVFDGEDPFNRRSVRKPSIVKVTYKNKNIIYDLGDGYQSLKLMNELLPECDYYFKRSYSREKNALLFAEFQHKMFPLGFNYMVAHKDDATKTKLGLKQRIKKLIGLKPTCYYTSDVFEGDRSVINDKPKILFYTRLWSKEECGDDNFDEINSMRIDLIRKLRAEFPGRFSGGVKKTDLARSLCPDLIIPWYKSNKSAYINRLHQSDICIGSTGLHQSIGWKTGEYIAAGKAIVAEHFEYEVTGNFTEGENYFGFKTADECVAAVKKLVNDPELLKRMKQNNRDYYNQYLRPDVLVKNTLDIVDKEI